MHITEPIPPASSASHFPEYRLVKSGPWYRRRWTLFLDGKDQGWSYRYRADAAVHADQCLSFDRYLASTGYKFEETS